MSTAKNVPADVICRAANLSTKKSKKIVWHTTDIIVRYSLGIDEYANLISKIITSCTDKDGDCVLAFVDFAVRVNVILAYSNVCLPTEPKQLFDISYSSDLYEAVYKNACSAQIDSIIYTVRQCINVGGN